jgi:hypothetical protein
MKNKEPMYTENKKLIVDSEDNISTNNKKILCPVCKEFTCILYNNMCEGCLNKSKGNK